MKRKYSKINPFVFHKPVKYDYDAKLPKPLGIVGWTNMYCSTVGKGMIGSGRKQTEALKKFEGIEGFSFEKHNLGSFTMYSIVSNKQKDVERRKVVYHVHGGGFYFPLGIDAIKNAAIVADKLDAVVFFPDYRVSVDYPYPTPLTDCINGYKYILDHAEELRIDRENIVIYGDSAGGCLCASLTLLIRDQGLSYASRLTEAGNKVVTKTVHGGYHGYTADQSNPYVMKIWEEQIDRMKDTFAK